jgi:hypothetical protein
MAGSLTLEYSALSADGASGLGLVVYRGATPSDARAIEQLLSGGARKPAALLTDPHPVS